VEGDVSAEFKLSGLAIGASAVVRGYPKSGDAFLRLREMGVLPGTTVTLVRTAPLGDPLEIKVRGYHLTLRRSEADHVLVESINPAP
jgi:ferrous iron transport protein A